MTRPAKRKRNQPQRQEPRASQPSVSLSLSQSRTDVYPAILPAADEMERYEEMAPGCVERIITQFERQSEHRRRLEYLDMSTDVRLSYAGMASAVIIVVAFIIAGTYLIVSGHSVAGAGSGLTGVGIIAATFIYGSKSRRAEREQKQRILSGDRG